MLLRQLRLNIPRVSDKAAGSRQRVLIVRHARALHQVLEAHELVREVEALETQVNDLQDKLQANSKETHVVGFTMSRRLLLHVTNLQ